jgi:hypothetical protein
MTLPLLVVGLLALVVALVAVAALIGWHPHGPATERPDLPTVDPSIVADWCEHIDRVRVGGFDYKDQPCPNTPTHELVGSVNGHGDGGHSAMVATYCEEHAPTGSVRVRWVEVASAGG